MSPESPRPRSVSARPVATWLETRMSVRTPNSAAMRHTGSDGCEIRRDRGAGEEGCAEAADRAHHHHALDAEIEDARAFGHQFAQRREQQAASTR